ncbi:menaquinol-cytochrome c reductase cytochrome b subunit precursor [Saccharopolyspora erythraea NRRL 2338]|uniref:Cytochrome bc1 complex cytochrome b subunit n=2 Tax=Saccharopolyspora erythraea TaxID=1836 RepID=A4FAD1_SACEN|nr:cytochrome bc complex cytochrome b subunit [Saccharopolyspora erythraea]EQD86404.1 menaquinol-cytochrome C reductase cytochrome b subunit [Saccharopolyspora erythraea D]PFG94792.1 menaquinol-cytochrome c reductase cytochrome b subunit precursor [Saccharopolyspora erythraea NRRL 2338]QRK91509.1 cytochrome bc complex cytochrome b subunit [Saccharopolyspora erythraea]CAM01006.1 cytochrome b, membrane protein [Saccharopolyspora erythraea NRRL 2338]
MSSITTPTKSESAVYKKAATAADELDQRFRFAKGMRRQLNKVFPTHWSFLLGEIALYSFVLLLLTGVWLTLFFDPSMEEVVYDGVYRNLQGVEMSKAFASTLDISFEVRGGLFIRQLHHWAALIFVASMMAHMARIFFTGAFRKPRESNWTIGALLLILGMFEGFFGYSLPDDLLSGTGIRATLSGIVLSIPLLGTWLHWALFGGEFPGMEIIPRLYVLHVLLIPGIMLGLIAAHLALVWYQKHTQFPGVRRKETNVVGIRIMPTFAVKGGSLFAVVTGVLAIMSGLFQINPIWNLGPYNASQVSAASQPDWYLAWADGILRVWPAWELYLGPYTVPPVFFAGAIGMGILFTVLIAYPAIERKLSKDDAHHNLLQRPRDVPVRTSLGMMALSFFMVLMISGNNDVIAFQFNISLNAMTWFGRLGLLLLPPIAYWVTYRICLGLQRADREVLEHGVETGIIKRLPHGEFIEIHQPLGPVDEHGHPEELPYQGAPVPKKMNKLGAAGHPVPGSLLKPDPQEETEALERALHEDAEREREEREQRELISGKPKVD